MVVQFVAFLGAYRDPGTPTPWGGALLTTWVTFVPCFLFIFLGAPYVERLRHNTAISTALTGITAAVVGVIANLVLYFAQHTLFGRNFIWAWGPFTIQLPELATLSPIAPTITVAALIMTFVLKWPLLRILGICALLGMGTILLPCGQAGSILNRGRPRPSARLAMAPAGGVVSGARRLPEKPPKIGPVDSCTQSRGPHPAVV